MRYPETRNRIEIRNVIIFSYFCWLLQKYKIIEKKHPTGCFVGAEDEIRTRDVHLGKVTLYH